MFRLPDLPGPYYKKMQEIREFHKLTQWQVFILMIQFLTKKGEQHKELIGQLATELRSQSPGNYKTVVEDA